MERILSVIDVTSMKLCSVSIWSGLISLWNMGIVSSLAGWVALAAGSTTVVYNMIRIYKELKSKKDERNNLDNN